jgi:Putative adhesin
MPTFDTPTPIAVSLEFGIGDVRITASERSDTTVDVRPSDPEKKADVEAATQTRVEYGGGRLLVKGPGGWRGWLPKRGHESIDIEIALPVGSRVHVDAGVASLQAVGRLGEFGGKVGVGDAQLDETGALNLRTGAGAITVARVDGKTELVTGSGAVRIGTVNGSAWIKNSNGETSVGVVTGDVHVNAANGSITIGRADAGVVAKTANGRVSIGEVAHGTAVAQSAFGDLEVGIRDGVPVWLDLRTKFGQVRNELDASSDPGDRSDAVEVHASTSMGDIAIRRSFASSAGSAS